MPVRVRLEHGWDLPNGVGAAEATEQESEDGLEVRHLPVVKKARLRQQRVTVGAQRCLGTWARPLAWASRARRKVGRRAIRLVGSNAGSAGGGDAVWWARPLAALLSAARSSESCRGGIVGWCGSGLRCSYRRSVFFV